MALLTLAALACSSQNHKVGPGADAGAAASCLVAADCTRTEIDYEITSPADCICLYGCPFNIVNTTTASRRMAQYQASCTPGRDRDGRLCGIDDCALLPPLVCVNQACVATQ